MDREIYFACVAGDRRDESRGPLRKRCFKRVNRMVDFIVTARERQHENHGVEDGSCKQAVGAGGETDGFAEALVRREFFAIGPPQFNARDEPALSNFMDQRLTGFQRGQAGS